MTIYVACFIAFFIWFRPSQEKVHYNKCLCTEFKDQIIIILMSHIEIYSVCINQSEERQIVLHFLYDLSFILLLQLCRFFFFLHFYFYLFFIMLSFGFSTISSFILFFYTFTCSFSYFF